MLESELAIKYIEYGVEPLTVTVTSDSFMHANTFTHLDLWQSMWKLKALVSEVHQKPLYRKNMQQ